MRVSVILAHPNVQSFNHAIAQAAIAELTRQGHQVVFHDLYGEAFPPVLPAGEIPQDAHLSQEVALHCREISCADGIIIIHPNWWGQPPAILKGWIDRVTSTVEHRCEWLREVRDIVGRYLPGEIGA